MEIRFPPPPPTTEGQPFSVGLFYCLLLRTPMRILANSYGHPNTTLHFLAEYALSGRILEVDPISWTGELKM